MHTHFSAWWDGRLRYFLDHAEVTEQEARAAIADYEGTDFADRAIEQIRRTADKMTAAASRPVPPI